MRVLLHYSKTKRNFYKRRRKFKKKQIYKRFFSRPRYLKRALQRFKILRFYPLISFRKVPKIRAKTKLINHNFDKMLKRKVNLSKIVKILKVLLLSYEE